MITVFGSINLDLIFALDCLPQPGETVLGPGIQIEPGGKGANQAVAAARDGARVAMAGAVGRDALAAGALAGLRGAGVDMGRVAEVEAATGCAAICTDPFGRNLIAVGSGANLLARADQVEDALLGPGGTLVLQMEVEPDETAALIHRARRGGARIVLNLAPARALDPAALRAVDVLVVNEHEAAWLAAELGAEPGALRRALGVTVVRTLGERGAEFDGETVAPFAVQVLDSTAAGDCFTGVLAAALDRGLKLEAALRRASAAAALCCTRRGSQSSLPLAAETDSLLFSSGPIVALDRVNRPKRGPPMTEATLTISSRNYSSWSLRGWLITRMSGLPFTAVTISPDDTAAREELLLRSSSILVPCLTHDGVEIWDTLAIFEYLNELRPEANMLPTERLARARCRSISGEMHSGFSALRSSLPMNLRSRRPGFQVWSSAQADINRINLIWHDCLERWGGPFLFGSQYTLADAMFAPVCTRFRTYEVQLDQACSAYCAQIFALPDMVEWTREALLEMDEVEELEVEF